MIHFQLMTCGEGDDVAVRYFTEDEQADATERFAEAVQAANADRKAVGAWVRLTRLPDEVLMLDWHKFDRPTSEGSDTPPAAE